MTLSRLLARPMMSAIFVVGPITTLRNTPQAAKRAEPVTGPLTERLRGAGVPIKHNPELFVRLNAGVQLVGAAALATGKCPRLAAGVLAATLVPTTLAGHPFWRETDAEARGRQKVEFAKNVSLFGGLVIAALDTEGKPGKAWLARQAGKQAVRRAEQLAATGRLEAKIAALEAAGAGDHLAETLETATEQARETAAQWSEELRKQAKRRGKDARVLSAHLADQARDKSSDWADVARDKSSDWADVARDKSSDWADVARDKSSDWADVARDKSSDWADVARDKGSDWADVARDKGSDWADDLRKQAKRQRKQARKQARKTGRKLVKEARSRVA